MPQNLILAINPGSTSTKIAVYDGDREFFSKTIYHSADDLIGFSHIADQFQFRKHAVELALQEGGIETSQLKIVIGRGGLVKPIPSGVYEVNEFLKNDLRNPPMGEHASNLGGLIAAEIAETLPGVKAYIADPVVVDELEDIARISGHKLFRRHSIFHALNQKAVGKRYAEQTERKYDELNLIVAHLGGGISIGAHRKGRVIDVNNALDGEGPFSPERSGTLTARQVVKLCFSGEYNERQINRMISGGGGLTSLLESNNVRDILHSCDEGNDHAAFIVQAMAYNTAKYIGEMAVALYGKVDAIVLTGGIAHSNRICEQIEKMTSFIAPVVRIPGEDEMEALAMNAWRILQGKETPKRYQ